MSEWKPDSWRNFPILQQPEYPELTALSDVETRLKTFPPLVFAEETRQLFKQLADVSQGNGFVLQGGDCAESFMEFNAPKIRDTFKVILQMAIVLTYAGKVPVTKIARMAGQYAKPRSSNVEVRMGLSYQPTAATLLTVLNLLRTQVPNPDRMLQAYQQSAATLNLLRAFSQLVWPIYIKLIAGTWPR